MIKIDITESPFMDVYTDVGNQWMSDNIGELIVDDISIATGKGWRIYCMPATDYAGADRWYAEFDDDRHATWFLVRWS